MANSYLRKILDSPDTTEKMKVRDFIFSHNTCQTIVGLAGPKINEYTNWCKSQGYKNMELYENDISVAQYQLSQVKKLVDLYIGDINNTDFSRGDTFYDLDYCKTIKTAKNILPELKKNYCCTFALRPIGIEETLKTFWKGIGEKPIKEEIKESPIKHTIFTTDKGKYIFATYRDTSPMCSITKIK